MKLKLISLDVKALSIDYLNLNINNKVTLARGCCDCIFSSGIYCFKPGKTCLTETNEIFVYGTERNNIRRQKEK